MRNRWKPFLDSDGLKIIAVLTMFIDHLGASLLIEALRLMSAEAYDKWLPIYHVLRNVGRMSFPIFVFLLVEGFFYTRSRKKYLERLLLFSLLSEIPFDLAFYGSLFYEGSQNVFWALVIGLLVIWGIERLRKLCGKRSVAAATGGILTVVVILTGVMLAEWLHVDYGMHGILLTALFYLGKRLPVPPVLICFAGYLLFLWEPYSIGGFLMILCYNGARKVRGKGFQYFFYLFYPMHLLILGLVRVVFFQS